MVSKFLHFFNIKHNKLRHSLFIYLLKTQNKIGYFIHAQHFYRDFNPTLRLVRFPKFHISIKRQQLKLRLNPRSNFNRLYIQHLHAGPINLHNPLRPSSHPHSTQTKQSKLLLQKINQHENLPHNLPLPSPRHPSNTKRRKLLIKQVKPI